LVATYLDKFNLNYSHQVLDPFCGTGTTLIECKKRGIWSVGAEINPLAHFASQTKVNWRIDPDELVTHAQEIANTVTSNLDQAGLQDFPVKGEVGKALELNRLSSEESKLLLANSISALPLHKVLLLRDAINNQPANPYKAHEQLALAKVAVYHASNLRFGPEIGVSELKIDAPVIFPWLSTIKEMAADLRKVHHRVGTPAMPYLADARSLAQTIAPNSIDAVITSPPYPNEKDYTRTTRLESVLLGFIRNRSDLRHLKQGLIRSNTRNVFKSDNDDSWTVDYPEINRIALEIENRRIELGKTSGFERLYARVTKLYFGGMARHLADLRRVLRPGAHLAYVVGDQASYLRIMIRTGQLLSEIAQSLGYQVEGVDLFRTRLATVTREQLREEVLILRWPGNV
jgi:DNA modification methylase